MNLAKIHKAGFNVTVNLEKTPQGWVAPIREETPDNWTIDYSVSNLLPPEVATKIDALIGPTTGATYLPISVGFFTKLFDSAPLSEQDKQEFFQNVDEVYQRRNKRFAKSMAKLKSTLAQAQIDPQTKGHIRVLIGPDLSAIEGWARAGAKGEKTPQQVRLGIQDCVNSIRTKTS